MLGEGWGGRLSLSERHLKLLSPHVRREGEHQARHLDFLLRTHQTQVSSVPVHYGRGQTEEGQSHPGGLQSVGPYHGRPHVLLGGALGLSSAGLCRVQVSSEIELIFCI